MVRHSLEKCCGVSHTWLVMINMWSGGNRGEDEERTGRLMDLFCFVSSNAIDKCYKSPIEGMRLQRTKSATLARLFSDGGCDRD